MEKRLVIAIALSLMVLLTWSMMAPKPHTIESQEVTIPKPALVAPEQQKPASYNLFLFKQNKFDIEFNEQLAVINSVVFKEHQDYKFLLKDGFLVGDKSMIFRQSKKTDNSVAFEYKDQYKKIYKEFTFSNIPYAIMLEINVQNDSATPLAINLPINLGMLEYSGNNIQSRYQDMIVATKEKTIHITPKKNQTINDLKFLSLRDRYFCAIIEPETDNNSAYINKLSNQDFDLGLSGKEITLNPGQKISEKYRIYLGPQQLGLINTVNPNWSSVIYYGTFDFISQILLQLLEFLHKLVHSWGWAIVLLSLIVYFALYPLTLKQMRSMKEMQALQPHIEELRKLYKDNPQRLNKEIMELYREHKVNPLGGCLPLVLQMPIFFALYQALMRSIALKGSGFLWIKDLSEPDRLFLLPTSLPVLGNEINILPIVMAIGMFIQQKVSMVKTSDSAAEQQKIMMIIFPFMFGLIFYHMPSGLVLYWFVNSTLMLIYQLRVNKVK